MKIEEIVLLVYIVSLSFMFFIASHGINMIYLYFKTYNKRNDDINPEEFSFPYYPMVTIQLPLYNEKYVICRLIDACTRLEYPKDKLEIQILDDSTDDTKDIIQTHIQKYINEGFIINHIHRTNRNGYKAGALKEGLKTAKGDFVAIFDADFIPRKNFLRRTMPYFFLNEKMGLVQTRWEHINRDYSVITKTQAIALDGHFIIEQAVRNRAGYFINFNGTGGIWRKECIFDAGNWQADTLTEDLDLSYRAQMKNWQIKYLVNFTSPAELPVDINALRSQQFRWTKGAIETAKKLYPKVLKANVPLREKFQSFIHLWSNLAYPCILIAALLNPWITIIKETGEYDNVYKFMSVFIFAFLSSFIFYLYSQKDVYPDWQKRIIYFPIFMMGSMGLAVNNTKAVFEGLFNKKTEFVRTPKYKIVHSKDTVHDKKYHTKRVSFVAYIEGILSLYCFWGVWLAIKNAQIASIPFNLMFALGFGIISFLSFKQVINYNRAIKKLSLSNV